MGARREVPGPSGGASPAHPLDRILRHRARAPMIAGLNPEASLDDAVQ
jgi:hypothetical protein